MISPFPCLVLIQDLLLHIHNMDMALGTYTEHQLYYFNILPAFTGKYLPLDPLFKNSCADHHRQLQGEIINFKVRSMNPWIDLLMIAAWEELFPPQSFTWLHHILYLFQIHSEVSQALHVRTLQHERSRERLIPAFAVQPTINILNSAVPKCAKGRDYEIEINGHASYTTWCFTFPGLWW